MLSHLKEELEAAEGTRAKQMKKTEDELFELYKNPDLDHKPEQLSKRGGAHSSDTACETICSIYNNKNSRVVLTAMNNGAVPDLPAEGAVEVAACVGSEGAKPIAFGKLPMAERGWLQIMKAMEPVTEEAAVTGGCIKALTAFILNPQVPSGASAKRVLDELLIAHEKYLPQFAYVNGRLKEEGVEIKDEKVRALMKQSL